MKKTIFSLTLLLALVALLLCACGSTTVVDSQDSEDTLQVFGDTIDPSSSPTTAQVIESSTSPAVSATTTETGSVSVATDSAGTETAAEASPEASAETTSASSSTTTTTTTAEEEEIELEGASISPPIAASEAGIEDAQAYVGSSLSSMLSGLGYPNRSDYDYVDEEDPDAGEIGTLYYDGYIVKTLRTDSGETVTSVTAN